MGAEGEKIFEEHEVKFIAENANSDFSAEHADQYDSDVELANLKNDLVQLYEKKTNKKKYIQNLGALYDAIQELNDFSDKDQKASLINIVQQTLGQTKYSYSFQRSIENIFDGYGREVGGAVEQFQESLDGIVFDGEIELTSRITFDKLPGDEKQLLMKVVQGGYGNILRDADGNEIAWEGLTKEQKKQLKELVAIVQGVNMSSFFEAVNAYASGSKKGLEAVRQDFNVQNVDLLKDAWAKDGNLGKNYAQLSGYKKLKKVEQRRLAKLAIILLEVTDNTVSEELAPTKSLLIHLQASTEGVNVDNERKGAQFNERVSYVQAHAQAENITSVEVVDDETAGGILDVLIADQDGDMQVDSEEYAHQDMGYRATKGLVYQLLHLKKIKETRTSNKEARTYNKVVRNRRKEAAGKQKEAGANILFEGQLKRSLDTARKILNPEGTLTDAEVNAKILQNIAGLLLQHYRQLVASQVQIDENNDILFALEAYGADDCTGPVILDKVFLKYPQTFAYLRGFLTEHHTDAVNIFLDGSAYGNTLIQEANKTEKSSEQLRNINIPKPLLARLDEQYNELVSVLDSKVLEAKTAGASPETIQALEAQQESLKMDWQSRKVQIASDALTVIGSTINHAHGMGLATGVTAQLDNKIIQSIRLGGGLFQGIGNDSVAGTSLGLSLTIAGSKKTGKNDGGTLLYSLGAGTGANRNALGFLQGFDIGASLGHERTINDKTIASNLDPKAKVYFGAGFSASLLHGGIGPHLWLRNDKLLGVQEAEKKLLDPTRTLIEELLNENCLIEAEKVGKTLQMYIYEQLLSKKTGTAGGKESKLFTKTTDATLENASRNLAIGLMTYYSNPDFNSLSTNKTKKAEVAESIARQYLLHRSMEHIEDLKEGLASLHVSALDIGLQIVASGPAPLKVFGGTMTWYKDGYRSEDYQSREQAEYIKETGVGARELLGTFGSSIDLYNRLLDTNDGTFTEKMKLTTTKVTHEGKDYPAVHVPAELFDYLRDHDGGVALHKLEMVFMKKDETGIYISTDVPTNLITVATSGKNEYQLVIGDLGGVGKSQETQTGNSKVLYTIFNQVGDSIRTDSGGFAERDAAVQEVSREKYRAQFGEMFKGFMKTVNGKAKGFFIKPNDVPSFELTDFTINGSPDGTVRLPINPNMQFFGTTHTDFVKVDTTGTYLEVPLNGKIQVTKSTDPSESKPWKLEFIPSTVADTVQGLKFSYGESVDAFTKSEVIASEGFKLEAVQPKLIDYLKSRDGAETMLQWRYSDMMRTANPDHHTFYKFIQKKDFVHASQIARKYVKDTELILDNSDTGKANLYTLYAELSRVDMTEFKDVDVMSQAKEYAKEQYNALVSAKRIIDADGVKLLSFIDEIFDGIEPVKSFYKHQKEIERILHVTYVTDYNRKKMRDDPAYKLTYLLAPASIVDKTRTKALLRRIKNEPTYRSKESKDDFMQKRDQIFASMDETNVMANVGVVKQNYLGLVFGYGDGEIDEKIITHPPVMNFAGSIIQYNKLNNTEKNHVAYFVDNTQAKEPQFMLQDMQGMINYLNKQLLRTDLTEKSRVTLTAAKAVFESKKSDLNEIASLWKTGKFLNGTLPVGIESVEKDFAQTKYPKCVNDMIIASPTKIFPKIETEKQADIPLSRLGEIKVDPYRLGGAYVTTGVVGQRMTKDAHTVNVLTSHGNLEKTYGTVSVESTTEIRDLDTYLAGLTQEQRDAFIAVLGQPIQPGIDLDLGLGQGPQTYDGWTIGNNIWVVQDNSGTLPTMRLVNIVNHEILNTAVLSNRDKSLTVMSNAVTAQNLRKYGIIEAISPFHPASPIELHSPVQPLGDVDESLGTTEPATNDLIGPMQQVTGEIPSSDIEELSAVESQENYLQPGSVYGYTYQLLHNKEGAVALRVNEQGNDNVFTDIVVNNLSEIRSEIANSIITVGNKQVFLDVFGSPGKVTLLPLDLDYNGVSYEATKIIPEQGKMNPIWIEVPNKAVGGLDASSIITIEYKDTGGNIYVLFNQDLYKQNAVDSDNITYEKVN